VIERAGHGTARRCADATAITSGGDDIGAVGGRPWWTAAHGSRGVMVLRVPQTPALDLDRMLTIEQQPERIWE
jgi:hypothetical protein